MHDFDGHAGCSSDLKIVTATLGLRTPILIGGHMNFAHGVLFDTVIHILEFESLVCNYPAADENRQQQSEYKNTEVEAAVPIFAQKIEG